MLYRIPKSTKEALHILNTENSRVIAGGTDLVLDMRKEKYQVDTLVDITEIPELKEIKCSKNMLFIGAAVPFSEYENNSYFSSCKALQEGAGHVGSPQIRAVATLGGNLVNAMPAADAAVPLFVLDVKVQVENQKGLREIPVEDCYFGRGISAIEAGREIVTGFRIPLLEKNQGSSYQRFALRESLALPVACLAVALELRERKISWCRIAAGPCGDKPWRAVEAEKMLKDQIPQKDILESAGALIAEKASFRDSPARCSAAYKKKIIKVLFLDAVQEALEQAEGR